VAALDLAKAILLGLWAGLLMAGHALCGHAKASAGQRKTDQ
jgi:hypothetical protein